MLKRTFAVGILALATIFSTTSCASESGGKTDDNPKTKTENMKTEGKKLVVFFSHTGENYNVGYIEKGNTHILADMIADATGADRFEIVPANPYPDSYDECVEVAKQEKEAGARPAVKGDVKVEDYDIIFIGYPNWWGDVPMCVYTFIDKHNWAGKTVIPFITHEGSGMGGTDRKIAAACKGADVAVGKGLAVQGKVAQEDRPTAQKKVDTWLTSLNMK